MLSSLATRTSVQTFNISSMVRIMTMLCHRSGDSKCLPNLGREERQSGREQIPAPASMSTAASQPVPELLMGVKFRESFMCTSQPWYLPPGLPRSLCATGLEWGRTEGPRSDSARDLEQHAHIRLFQSLQLPFMDSVA